MRLEAIKPQTEKETLIRRKARAIALLKGITMRQAVYEALERWVEQEYEKLETGRIPGR